MAYPISNALKTYFAEENKQICRLTFTTKAGITFTATEKDIVQGTLVLDRAIATSDSLALGACIASELDFTLFNEDGKFDNYDFVGAEIYLEIGGEGVSFADTDSAVVGDAITGQAVVGHGNREYMPMGYFIIDKVPKVRTRIEISALDRMVKFDKVVDYATYTPWATGKMVRDYLIKACQVCGVTMNGSVDGYPQADYIVPSAPHEANLTWRSIVGWCCQLLGGFGWIDWQGKLNISYYNPMVEVTDHAIVGDCIVGDMIVGNYMYETSNNTPSAVERIASDNRFDSDYADEDVNITGITFADNNNTIYIAGTNTYAFDVTGNAMLQDYAYNLSNIYDVVKYLSYRPFSATTIPYPYLYPGDWVEFVLSDGVTAYSAMLTNVTYHLNGHMELASVGETEQSTSYANTGIGNATAHYIDAEAEQLAKRIELNASAIALKVDSDSVINQINLSNEGVQIDASKLNINGVISANGNFRVNTNGTIEANNGVFRGAIYSNDAFITGGRIQIETSEATDDFILLKKGELSSRVAPAGFNCVSNGVKTFQVNASNGAISCNIGTIKNTAALTYTEISTM